MAGRACELGGSCQRVLLGLWSERSGLVELQLLCKPSCPDPARAQWGFVRRQGLPGQSSLLIHSLGWRGAAFNPFLLLQQDFDPSLLWGFVFLLSASGNKQTNEQKNPNPSTSLPKHPKKPSKKTKETKQRKNHFLQVAIQHKLNKQEFRCC